MSLTTSLHEKSISNNIPLKVVIELTTRCNLRCCHCYVEPKSEDMLSTSEVKDLLDQLAAEGCMYLVMTGGEILERPDLLEILRYARAKQFALELKTNGSLTTTSPDQN